MSTLTSANSVLYLAVAGVFPVAQKIEGYATDDAFAFEAVQPAQVVMGVDGRMSAGYTPFMSIQTISIQADSPSLIVFEAYLAAMKTAREVFYCNGTLGIPSTNRKYAMSRGVLTQISPAPTARTILQPRTFQITWQDVSPALV
ncbi:hypothetical protein [Achromobacter sp. 2789STDY5608628]|uniref:phage tail fiber protein n=1 Tax=Achromobacter sp. 2789STDY5608628 TaxID=1806493 RepID=UPI0006C6B448|nr:hypothetical protein [Achromobacter sp. 2789STDY5608628]CUJ80790.1 Uncharacterised protein [Achromobacter sp. 2789STDY5608628]